MRFLRFCFILYANTGSIKIIRVYINPWTPPVDVNISIHVDCQSQIVCSQNFSKTAVEGYTLTMIFDSGCISSTTQYARE